jgi:hypothetical protein
MAKQSGWGVIALRRKAESFSEDHHPIDVATLALMDMESGASAIAF